MCISTFILFHKEGRNIRHNDYLCEFDLNDVVILLTGFIDNIIMYIMCILAVVVFFLGGGGAKGVTSIFSLGNF